MRTYDSKTGLLYSTEDDYYVIEFGLDKKRWRGHKGRYKSFHMDNASTYSQIYLYSIKVGSMDDVRFIMSELRVEEALFYKVEKHEHKTDALIWEVSQ